MDQRSERDALGERLIPADVYWGIHTLRARENFVVSARRVPAALIHALALVKKACVQANAELGYLPERAVVPMLQACDDVAEGRLDAEFPLDALQGGAGTSVNMNMNEVIANRALELLGASRGDYARVHPLDHVNRHQSTNDVYPTAVKVAAIALLRRLSASAAMLQGALQAKEKEFAGIVKIGRTEMQDAVPMTLGIEFSAWAEAVSRDRWRTFKCEERLRVVNIGGTAIGTGLGAPREYIFLVIEKLRGLTGQGLCRGENVPGETANADACVEVSGILKACASNLIKISNDLRSLNSLGEIRLAPVQPGSSIMPGKVNPVIPEAVIQGSLQVMANDLLVAEAASRSSFQINEFMPLLSTALLESLEILINITGMLAAHVGLIQADERRCREYFDQSRSIVTAFVPAIGYGRAEALVKEFDVSGRRDLRVFLSEQLGADLVEKILAPQNLISLGYRS
jgi:aspartate ammonia-lyase